MIGPNGAGKSTTFNLISGRFAPSSGHGQAQRAGDRRAATLRDQSHGAVAQLPDHQYLSPAVGVREPALRGALVAGLQVLVLASPVGVARCARARRGGAGADRPASPPQYARPACSPMPSSARWRSASPSPAAPK
ncbi:ATP-binding cassette domain-containing protein [Cupriavidus basilensis]